MYILILIYVGTHKNIYFMNSLVLHVIHCYCVDILGNKLTVNIGKSKIRVLNSTKQTVPFNYNDCIVQKVHNFRYLGMTFNRTGQFEIFMNMFVNNLLVQEQY